MASIIKLKRSSTAGARPSSLEEGELAINVKDQRIISANSSSVFDLFDGTNELQKTTGDFGDRQLTQTVVTSVSYYANATSFVGGDDWNSKTDTTVFNSALANTNAFITASFAVRDGDTFDPIQNLSLSSTTASEGDTISVAFASTKLANNTIVPFTISGTVSNTDFRIIEQRPEFLTSDLPDSEINRISTSGEEKTGAGTRNSPGEGNKYFYPAKYGEQVTSGKWYVEIETSNVGDPYTSGQEGNDSHYGWIAPNSPIISDQSAGGFTVDRSANWIHVTSGSNKYNMINTWDAGAGSGRVFGSGPFRLGLYIDLDGGETRLYIDGSLIDSSNTSIDYSSTGVTPFYASGNLHTIKWIHPDEYEYDITSTVGAHNRGWVGSGSLNGNRFNTLLMSANNAQANLKFEILSDGVSEGSETLIITTDPALIANTITIS